MDVEYLDTALLVGAVDQDLAIETPSAQQGRVEDFRSVCSREDNQARARVEAVEFHEKLV